MAGRDQQAGTRARWGAVAQPGLVGGYGPLPVSAKAAGAVASARLHRLTLCPVGGRGGGGCPFGGLWKGFGFAPGLGVSQGASAGNGLVSGFSHV